MAALNRAPGMLAIAAVPFMPYTPTALTRFDPPIHVHSPLLIVYSHKSFRLFWVPALSDPNPPKSQTSPDISWTVEKPRAPGMFPAAAAPRVPYTPL